MDSGQRPYSAPNFKRELTRYAERRRNAGAPSFVWVKREAANAWMGLVKVSANSTMNLAPRAWEPPVEPEPEPVQAPAEPEVEEFPW
jgi:hypothetical protein